jgi:alpha-ketoglutarate-dependent taurine dioxygenase
MKIERGPLHPSFGAEVVGVNLARHLDEETIAAIENEWTRYSLLLFRNVRAPPTNSAGPDAQQGYRGLSASNESGAPA